MISTSTKVVVIHASTINLFETINATIAGTSIVSSRSALSSQTAIFHRLNYHHHYYHL
jgi:hypothetical protein